MPKALQLLQQQLSPFEEGRAALSVFWMTEDVAFHRLQGAQHFREAGIARTCRCLDFLFNNSGEEICLAQTFTYLTFVNEIAVFWATVKITRTTASLMSRSASA